MHHKLNHSYILEPAEHTVQFPYGLKLFAINRHTLLDVYASFLQMEPQIAEYGFGYAVGKGSLHVANMPFAASMEHFSLVGNDKQGQNIPKKLPAP